LLVWLALFVVFARGRSRPSWRWMAPLLLTAGAALDAVRHIPIFVLLAIPMIAAALPAASPALPLSYRRAARSRLRLRPAFNIAVVMLLAVFALVRWVSLARGQNNHEAEQYPQKAAAFLETGRYPRNLFAYYDWGGYAIWKLYPGYRVFVDGRADLYGEDLLRQFKTAVDVRRGWREILDRWKIAIVLVPAKCALAQALLLDPNWHEEFSDPQATVLLRMPAVVKNTGLPPETYPPAGSQRHNKGKE